MPHRGPGFPRIFRARCIGDLRFRRKHPDLVRQRGRPGRARTASPPLLDDDSHWRRRRGRRRKIHVRERFSSAAHAVRPGRHLVGSRRNRTFRGRQSSAVRWRSTRASDPHLYAHTRRRIVARSWLARLDQRGPVSPDRRDTVSGVHPRFVDPDAASAQLDGCRIATRGAHPPCPAERDFRQQSVERGRAPGSQAEP